MNAGDVRGDVCGEVVEGVAFEVFEALENPSKSSFTTEYVNECKRTGVFPFTSRCCCVIINLVAGAFLVGLTFWDFCGLSFYHIFTTYTTRHTFKHL